MMKETVDEIITEEAEAVESAAVTEEEPDDPIAALREEIATLRALVETRREVPAELTESFRSLYPDVSRADIPDAVFEEAQAGLPLEAAYALYERREALRKQAAERVNRQNAVGGWGRADGAGEDFLSPDEVREMTPAEVRRNYARIVESMKHWT